MYSSNSVIGSSSDVGIVGLHIHPFSRSFLSVRRGRDNTGHLLRSSFVMGIDVDWDPHWRSG